MYISTVNISQTVTDGANIAISNKEKVARGLYIGYLYLELTHSKDQAQGHANFDRISRKW